MRTRLTTLSSIAVAAALTALLTGCSGSDGKSRTTNAVAADEAAGHPTEPTSLLTTIDGTCCLPSTPTDLDTDGDDDFADLFHRTPLQDLFYADAPTGTGPEMALRFLRALQRHDHLAAADELFVAGRNYFGTRDQATLDRVMRDIAANARLTNAGPCTSAERLNREAALVTCGRQKVVVHVLDEVGSGVQISKWHPRYDVYRGAHSHAFTNDDLS